LEDSSRDLNVLKDQQSRELRIIRTTSPAAYVCDNANKYTQIRPWRNEELKVDKEKKRYTKDGSSAGFNIALEKGREKKEKTKTNYYHTGDLNLVTGDSNLVTHPSSSPAVPSRRALSGRKTFLVV